MTPQEFKTVWTKFEDNLQPISIHTLSRFKLNEDAVDFLSISGLPDYAAPFLNFVGDFDTHNKYSTVALLPEWFNFLETEFERFVIIGSDGSGDVIAIDLEDNCTIKWLDHEDYFSSKFMNTSVGQLANFLLVYQQFIISVNKDKIPAEDISTTFTDSQFDALKEMMKTIDSNAVEQGFWKEDLEILLALREDSMRK